MYIARKGAYILITIKAWVYIWSFKVYRYSWYETKDFFFFASNMTEWFCICMWLFSFYSRSTLLKMNFFTSVCLWFFRNSIKTYYWWALSFAEWLYYKQYGGLVTFGVDYIRALLVIDNLHKIIWCQKFLCVIFLAVQLTKPCSKMATRKH